jgi:hypothetical protein
MDTDQNLSNFVRPCKHDTKTYSCLKVTDSDVKVIRKKFYRNKTKVSQDSYICRYLAVATPKKRKKYQNDDNNKQKPRSMAVTYQLPTPKSGVGLVRVCQRFFNIAVGLKRDRVLYIAKILHEGKIIKENRSGDRRSKKMGAAKDAVRKFIGKLKAQESHYTRAKSARIYLSSGLSIKKLNSMYNAEAEPDVKVNYTMFRRVFVSDFNIGFSSPASDVCTYCLRTRNQILIEKDEKKRQMLITERRIHKLRSKQFYQLGKETPDKTITLCFDLQQVQPLPKTPIQESFYSRQLSFYSLCIVEMNTKNPKFYVWTEELAGRGALEVGSALLTHLKNLDLVGISHIRLFCDGCGGQNRNVHILHAIFYWLKILSPPEVKNITIIFPVRGHSFLPADRVFGRVEKILRRHPLITLKEDYIKLYAEVGEVKVLGEHWKIYDIKELQKLYQKLPGIREFKKVEIKKFQTKYGEECKLRSLLNYRFVSEADLFKNISLRGKKDLNFKLKELPLVHQLKSEKK